MPPVPEQKQPEALRLRDAVLEGLASRARLIGMAAGVSGAITGAVLIEAFFVLVGLIAPHSTIEGLGPARFVLDDQRLGQVASIGEGAAGGLAFISDLWFAFVVFGLSGFAFGQVFHSVGRARASWSVAGVLLPIFGACMAGIAMWGYLSMLEYGSRLADREHWADKTLTDRIWTSDIGILIVSLLITVPVSLALLTLWRWWFARIARFLVPTAKPVEKAPSETEEEAPVSYIEYQQRVRRAKRDSVELRAVERDWRRVPDPIIEATVVVDRDSTREVPPWMEPMAKLNSTLGRPLLAVFVVSLAIWFAAGVARDRQDWNLQRNSLALSSEIPIALTLKVADYTKSLRIFALSGLGTLDVVLEDPSEEEPVEIGSDVVINAREPGRAEVNRARSISHDFEDTSPGLYRVVLTLTSGDLVRLGYSLGFDVPDSWRFVGALLGFAAAGLIASLLGLIGITIGNVVAYFRR